jgi:hypothetical protein
MRAPVQTDRGRDPSPMSPASMYAPPWARDAGPLASSQRLRLVPPAAPPLPAPEARRHPRDPKRFEDDGAIRSMRELPTLGPVVMSDLPARGRVAMLERAARATGLAIPQLARVLGAVGLAALVAVFMVGAAPRPLQSAANAVGNAAKPLWSNMTGAKATQQVPAAGTLHREEIAALYQRGEQLIGLGDIAAARLMFARAAKVGDARSALALGASYDPGVLKKLGVIGIAANAELARDWYAKASGLGSREAAQRIERLAQAR